MSARWHCRVLEQELGPLDFADLVRLVRDGTLAADDLVRREGAAEWSAAETVVGLFHAARTAPIPPTKNGDRCLAALEPPWKPGGGSEPVGNLPTETIAAGPDRVDAPGHVVSDRIHTIGGRSLIVSQDDCDPAGVEEAGPLTRGLRWGFVGALLFAGIALGWSEWVAHAESRRFPLPAALRERAASAGHHFLVWGPLSLVEYLLLWMDVLAVVAFCAFLLWRPRREKRGQAPRVN